MTSDAASLASSHNEDKLREDVANLEQQLRRARLKLQEATDPLVDLKLAAAGSHHSMLILADSALPLGSFAFSSGLESYLAHHPRPANFHRFLSFSLNSIARATIPYVLSAHNDPHTITTLDNDLDASTPCTVARRASVAQGRALLNLWDRCFRAYQAQSDAAKALEDFRAILRVSSTQDDVWNLPPNGHLAPLWGIITAAMGVSPYESVYVYLMNHVKAVLSAAVRSSVMGPYQAQGILAGPGLKHSLVQVLRSNWEITVEDSGQPVPVLDLWMGRHELLYSRIFNS